MGIATRSALPTLTANSEIPESGKRARSTTRARPRLAHAIGAVAFFVAFWAFADASDWFVDAPFSYTTNDEWSQNLVKSSARGVRLEEAALYLASLFGVLPALYFAASLLRERTNRSPLRALTRFAGRSNGRFPWLLAGLATSLAWLGSKYVLNGSPLIDDERSYVFAARQLISGSFFHAAVPAAFRNPMVLTAPAWISKYPPGFAAILAPGLLVGVPRLMPCVIAGLSVLGVFQLAKSLFGLRCAVLACVLWTFSPFHLAISSTTMIFGASGCLALWTSVLTLHGLRGSHRALLGAALLGALHVLVRSFDAALVLATLSLAIAACEPASSALRRIGVLAAGFALGVAALAAFNQRVFGAPFSSGYTVAHDYRFGFFVHSLPGFSYEHTPVQALSHVIVAFVRLDGWLIGVPGALFLATLTLSRPSRRERALLLAVAVHLLGYSLMASSGTFDVGPTYYYLVAPCYLLLAIRGGLRLQLMLARKYRSALSWAAIAAVPLAWSTVVPLKAARLSELSSAIAAPWAFLASRDLSEGLVVVPSFKSLHAAGYGLGYPYQVATRRGSLQLIRPKSAAELLEAARSLHYSGPVYRLELDEAAFQLDGSRRFELSQFARASDVRWPARAGEAQPR